MFLKSFRQSVFRIWRNIQIKNHKLNYLFWECTLRCNLDCLHCGSDCLKNSQTPDTPLKDFVKVLDEIKAGGIKNLFICITGGEPLLRNDLEQAGQEIIKRGYNWGIVTNGMLLTNERFVSLVKAGMSSISFDMDGLEAEHNYLRRNKHSFEKVVNAIRTAVTFQKKFPSFIFDVITCVHPGNINSLNEVRDFLISENVKRWRIFSIFPEGRAKNNELFLSAEQYKQLIEFISSTRKFKTQQNKRIHVNYSCEGYLGKYELKVRDYFFFCQAGISIGSVMCNGDISACLSVRAKDFIQGNIYKDNFMDIWNKKFCNMRDHSWAKTGRCKKCRNWNNCLGNGIHLHENAHSEPAVCNYKILNTT